MQPLLDGPRATLTEEQVRGLLQSHSTIKITYGATGLDGSFGEVADISQYVGLGSTINSDVTAITQKTCLLNIDADVVETGWSYLSGFVRPFMDITDVATGVTARFHLGVYTLTTPTVTLGTTPATLAFAGYDLTYLLNQEIGDSYEVPVGADPAQAAADVISLAIPEVSVAVQPSGSTLATQLTWAFDATAPTTFLEIIQTLLNSVGYEDIWADWEGVFQVAPWDDPQGADYEWIFDTSDGDNILADQRAQEVDLYDVPNWWRFVMADLADTPIEGTSQFTWDDTSATNPGSTVNRGRTIRHIESVPTASYDDLLSYAQQTIAANLKPSEVFAVNSAPFPLAWHLDVILYRDKALEAALPIAGGGARMVVATQWSLPLDGQSDMQWSWQTITDQNATLAITTTG